MLVNWRSGAFAQAKCPARTEQFRSHTTNDEAFLTVGSPWQSDDSDELAFVVEEINSVVSIGHYGNSLLLSKERFLALFDGLRIEGRVTCFPAQWPAVLNQRQTVASGQRREKSRIKCPIV